MQYVSGLSWVHTGSAVSVTTSLARNYTSYDFLQRDSLLNDLFVSDSRESETSVRVELGWFPSPELQVRSGVSGRLARVSGDLQFPSFVTTFGDSVGSFSSDWSESFGKVGLYSEVGAWVTPQVRVVGGLRGDWFEALDNEWALSPRLAAVVRVDSRTNFSVAVGRYHQAPSYVWLSTNRANRSLDHLRADQTVVGLQREFGGGYRFRVEGYLKQYSRYPASTQRPYLILLNAGAGFGGLDAGFSSFGTDDLASVGEGTARGVDLLLEKRLLNTPFYGRAGITVGQARFTALDGVERPSAYEQRFIANLGGGYRPGARWEFAFKFRIGEGRPATPFLPDGMQDPGAFNSIRLPAFHSLDLRVDRRWSFRSWSLVAYVDVQNVYNRKNFTETRWDPRAMMTEEVGGSIGVLPTIGLSADF